MITNIMQYNVIIIVPPLLQGRLKNFRISKCVYAQNLLCRHTGHPKTFNIGLYCTIHSWYFA